MIRSFRHKGLKAFWEKGEAKKLPARQVKRIKIVLDRLDSASALSDMDVTGFYFHALTGSRKGTYSIRITGNWRVTFQWEDGDATNVNYEDYH